MKKFIGYFKDFHNNYFNYKLYLVVLTFIGLLITLNYTFDIEDGFIDTFSRRPAIRGLLFMLIHGLAYYGVLLIIFLFDRTAFKWNIRFWVKSGLGFLILATDRSVFPVLSGWLLDDLPNATFRFYNKLLVNSYGLLTIAGTLLIMKFCFDRRSGEGLYGLKFQKVDFKAYFFMWLMMIPIVYAASFIPEFIDYYPNYKRAGGFRFAQFYGFSETISKLVYEFFYLTDFLNTELFFRGFLIIGLSRSLGRNSVLPMAATYAVLHFGKPMGETISSVFGGYILGVLALYSRNIWGGVFIHGGIALLMELFAFARMPH